MIHNKNKVIFMKNISFLKKLPEASLNEILLNSVIKSLKRDEILFFEGDQATKFYIVLCGTFKLYNETVNGSESVTRLLSSGDFFGERSLSDNPIYSSCAEATRNSQLLEISADSIKKQMQLDCRTGMVILQEILNCQSKLESQIEYLSVMNAPQRIGRYLINTSNQNNKSEMNKVVLKHEKSLIATFLGMKPETFSRAIKKLKEANVHVHGSEIELKDIDLLDKYCTDKLTGSNTKSAKYMN